MSSVSESVVPFVSAVMANWANVPCPALNLIAKFLTFSLDYVRFRSVCTSWRSAAPKHHLLPLLAGHRVDADDLPTIFDFSCFSGSQIVPTEMPEMPLGRLCCGSSHGWMALLDPTPGIALFNPFTKSRIVLPVIDDFPDINEGRLTHCTVSKSGDHYVISSADKHCKEVSGRSFWEMRRYLASKLVLSSDPSVDPDCVALLLRCRWRRLAVCRFGDDAWTPVKFREFRNFNTDALFYRGKFHVVCRQALYFLHLEPEPELERIPTANPPFDEASRLRWIDECYLVESAGDLLVVYAYYRGPGLPSKEYDFEVYKVDWGLHRVKMLKLKNLGDFALFLGRNQSISLPASKYPGLRGNCIYMAEYYRTDRAEIRVYNMEDGGNDFISNGSADTSSGWRPCAWIMPSLIE